MNTIIFVEECEVSCPHCGERNRGWVMDPRGEETECDVCSQTFVVPKDAEIKFNA